MSDIYEMVKKFHETYNCGIGTRPELPQGLDVRALRVKILREEFDEYESAEGEDDLVEIADALADIVYIAFGTAIVYGIPLNDVLEEVQRSNMSKLGVDGKPIIREDGKVLKGPNYFKPNIAKILYGQ